MNPSSVFITGATGFVGSHLLAQLKSQGYASIRCAIRPSSTLEHTNCFPIDAIHAQTHWDTAFKDISIVIHCAARVHVMHETTQNPLAAFREINTQGTLHLAREAAKQGVKQFIFLSTAKVNGESTKLLAFDETQMPHPEDAYSISKWEAEQGLVEIAQQTGMKLTIIRPPLIYGKGVGANFLSLIRWVEKTLPLPFASIKNKRSLVYVKNLTSFITHCMDNAQAYNQVFLIADSTLSTPALLQSVAQAMNVPSKLYPFPVFLLTGALSIIGKKNIADRLCGSLELNSQKASQLLAWHPPYSLEEGLQDTVQHYLQHKAIKKEK